MRIPAQKVPWIICDFIEYYHVVKSNNYAMKEWHLEHVEKTIVRFVAGLSQDANSYERRNYKKYGGISYCIRQIEYDIHHGVEMDEVLEILRKIRLNKKYAKLRSNAEAKRRLKQLEDQLSGSEILPEKLLWHSYAYKQKG
jgi:hypothetical protein